ncbi:MAG: hypothetical protein FWH52_06710 [Synergistaceae bacterium]|nr:hypothetical protein [Synergistaceae bacterium]
MRIASILDLERCSKKLKKAVVCFTTVFFLLMPSESQAISIKGMPKWVASTAIRSIEAVWKEIKLSIPKEEQESTLKIVIEQLFQGYEINEIKKVNTDDLEILFEITGDSLNWSVEINYPQLRYPADEWFSKDIEGIDRDIHNMINTIPIEALSWMDAALREQIKSLIEERLSGWDFSIIVRLSNESKLMQISFTPIQPYVLSITPKVTSNALPVMFHSDLSAKLVTDMSPIIGIPVSWAQQHEEDISQFAVSKLEVRNAVINIHASVNAKFTPEQISKIETSIDSEKFFFSLRLAGYAGVRNRPPELWLTAGWKTGNLSNLPLDIYSESYITLDEFKFYTRLGGRFEIHEGVMIGAEMAFPGDSLWYRLWWDDRRRKPYFWWRWNADFGHNFALGVRVRDDLALELLYDETYRDKFSIRGIFQF